MLQERREEGVVLCGDRRGTGLCGRSCMRLDPTGIRPKLGPLHLGVTLRAVGSLEVRAGAANRTGLGRGGSWEGWGLTLVLVFWHKPSSWFEKILLRVSRSTVSSCPLVSVSHICSLGTGAPKRDLPPTSLPHRQVEPDPATLKLGRRPVSKEKRLHRPDSLAGGRGGSPTDGSWDKSGPVSVFFLE